MYKKYTIYTGQLLYNINAFSTIIWYVVFSVCMFVLYVYMMYVVRIMYLLEIELVLSKAIALAAHAVPFKGNTPQSTQQRSFIRLGMKSR